MGNIFAEALKKVGFEVNNEYIPWEKFSEVKLPFGSVVGTTDSDVGGIVYRTSLKSFRIISPQYKNRSNDTHLSGLFINCSQYTPYKSNSSWTRSGVTRLVISSIKLDMSTMRGKIILEEDNLEIKKCFRNVALLLFGTTKQ